MNKAHQHEATSVCRQRSCRKGLCKSRMCPVHSPKMINDRFLEEKENEIDVDDKDEGDIDRSLEKNKKENEVEDEGDIDRSLEKNEKENEVEDEGDIDRSLEKNEKQNDVKEGEDIDRSLRKNVKENDVEEEEAHRGKCSLFKKSVKETSTEATPFVTFRTNRKNGFQQHIQSGDLMSTSPFVTIRTKRKNGCQQPIQNREFTATTCPSTATPRSLCQLPVNKFRTNQGTTRPSVPAPCPPLPSNFCLTTNSDELCSALLLLVPGETVSAQPTHVAICRHRICRKGPCRSKLCQIHAHKANHQIPAAEEHEGLARSGQETATKNDDSGNTTPIMCAKGDTIPTVCLDAPEERPFFNSSFRQGFLAFRSSQDSATNSDDSGNTTPKFRSGQDSATNSDDSGNTTPIVCAKDSADLCFTINGQNTVTRTATSNELGDTIPFFRLNAPEERPFFNSSFRQEFLAFRSGQDSATNSDDSGNTTPKFRSGQDSATNSDDSGNTTPIMCVKASSDRWFAMNGQNTATNTATSNELGDTIPFFRLNAPEERPFFNSSFRQECLAINDQDTSTCTARSNASDRTTTVCLDAPEERSFFNSSYRQECLATNDQDTATHTNTYNDEYDTYKCSFT